MARRKPEEVQPTLELMFPQGHPYVWLADHFNPRSAAGCCWRQEILQYASMLPSIVRRVAMRVACNYGIWSWGDEIVVGFTVGYHDSSGGFHTRDTSRPFVAMQARSLDGGQTWEVASTLAAPQATGVCRPTSTCAPSWRRATPGG